MSTSLCLKSHYQIPGWSFPPTLQYSSIPTERASVKPVLQSQPDAHLCCIDRLKHVPMIARLYCLYLNHCSYIKFINDPCHWLWFYVEYLQLFSQRSVKIKAVLKKVGMAWLIFDSSTQTASNIVQTVYICNTIHTCCPRLNSGQKK